MKKRDFDIAFRGLALGQHKFQYGLDDTFFTLFEYSDYRGLRGTTELKMLKSDAAVVVKHLAYAVYDGQLSAQQAYAKAFRSGVPHEQLYQAFNDLSDGVNQ